MCDFPDCNIESTQQVTRLACFHTCHLLCLEKNGNSCPICKDPLLKRITDLSDTFNNGLLENKDNSPAINETNEQSTSQPDISTTTGRNAEFYKSHEWENFISTSFEQLVIPQPSVPHTTTRERTHTTGSTSTTNPRQNHCSHCGRPGHRRSRGSRVTCPVLLQSNSQSAQQTTQSTVQPPSHNSHIPLSSQASTLQVLPSTAAMVTSWELPVFLSQSTIGGRNGSNACTVISLLLAKTYVTNKQLLQINNSQPLSQNWIVAFISCMLGGNQAYDTFISSHNPIYLGVVEAIPLIRNSLGSLNYEEELTVCFTKEACAADESALSYQLSRRLGNANAAFTIINGMTITFVADSNGSVLVLDSHLHLPNGALLAKCKRDDIEGLLHWLKAKLFIGINLCTVTFIKFN